VSLRLIEQIPVRADLLGQWLNEEREGYHRRQAGWVRHALSDAR
jgi:hypothetical protein